MRAGPSPSASKTLNIRVEGAPNRKGPQMTRSLENLAKRRPTGGRTRASRGRRAYERDGYSVEPLVGTASTRKARRRGGRVSSAVIFADHANVSDPSGKSVKSKIVRVKSSPANRDYERRGVITRGAVLETEAGEAVVTSRPTADGVVNAVLAPKK